MVNILYSPFALLHLNMKVGPVSENLWVSVDLNDRGYSNFSHVHDRKGHLNVYKFADLLSFILKYVFLFVNVYCR